MISQFSPDSTGKEFRVTAHVCDYATRDLAARAGLEGLAEPLKQYNSNTPFPSPGVGWLHFLLPYGRAYHDLIFTKISDLDGFCFKFGLLLDNLALFVSGLVIFLTEIFCSMDFLPVSELGKDN